MVELENVVMQWAACVEPHKKTQGPLSPIRRKNGIQQLHF